MSAPRKPAVASEPTALFRAFLMRASRRLTAIAAAEGAAAGLGLAALIAFTAWLTRGSMITAFAIGATIVVLGAAAGFVIAMRRRRRVATLVERGAPQSRNLIVTAAELIDAPLTPRPGVRALVIARATQVVNQLDPARLFPAKRAVVGVLAGA